MDITCLFKRRLGLKSLQTLSFLSAVHRFFIICFLLSSSFTYAIPCDPQSLKKALNSVYGYKERHGICEGLYSTKVSAGFEIVALEEEPMPSYQKGDVLRIIYPNLDLDESLVTLPLNILGVALRPETYYRMDTLFTSKKDIFWPVDILVADGVALTNKDIGILGWIETAKTRLLFPVSTVIGNATMAGSSVRMTLRSGAPIQRLNWYLVVNDKRVEKHKLKGGIPAGEPIEIVINWPEPRPKKIKIEIVAKAHQTNEPLTPIFEIAVPMLTKSDNQRNADGH